MPLNFEDVRQDAKKGKSKDSPTPSGPKASGAAPLQLDTQVLPQLIRKVGDWKSGRISQQMTESFLDKHTLIFDRELLAKMFTEADYQKDGSLDARALAIAISGRFPKREHTEDWRKLTALLLGLPELVLGEDAEASTRYIHSRPSNGGTYNSVAAWDGPAPELPAVRRRSARSKSAQPSGEWKATASAVFSATQRLKLETPPDGMASSGPSFMSAPSFFSNPSISGPSGTGFGMAGGYGTLLTTGGLKQLGQIEAEMRINGGGLGVAPGGAAPRATFSAAREFADFSQGLELMPQLDAAGAGPGSTAQFGSTGARAAAATFLGSPKASVKSWSTTLPPTAISLPQSSLSTLRASIRSTASTKADFVTRHRPLGSTECDFKRTLGAPLDLDLPLNRVEPVRGTKVLPGAGYVEWGGFAATCRTAPQRWFSEHPAALAQDTGSHKYPWC